MADESEIKIVQDLKELQNSIEKNIEEAKRKEKLEILKKKAIKRQNRTIRKAIQNGQMVLDTKSKKKVIQKISLFEWTAPIRKNFIFSKRDFLIIVTLTLVFMLYLSILGKYMLMLVLASLLFFIYVAGLFEPLKSTHKITTHGIEVFNILYPWDTLNSFYFTKLEEQYFLVIETKLRVESRIILLLDKKDLEPIFILLQDKLLYKPVKNNKLWFGDRLSLGQYIPIEEI